MAGRSSAGVMTADEFVISEARSGLGKHGLLSCRHVLQAHRMGEFVLTPEIFSHHPFMRIVASGLVNCSTHSDRLVPSLHNEGCFGREVEVIQNDRLGTRHFRVRVWNLRSTRRQTIFHEGLQTRVREGPPFL